MGCENLYSKVVLGSLSMLCRDFYANCTVPTFDDGHAWFDTTCIFTGAQLRRVGIEKVHMVIRVATYLDSEINIELTMRDDSTPRNIGAKYGRNLIENGVDTLTYSIAEVVFGTKAINCIQQGVLIAHIEAIGHKLRKVWAEQAKFFNGYTALIGKE